DKNLLYIRRQLKVSNTYTVYQERPKTDNSIRHVAMPSRVKELIQQQIAENAKKKEWLGDAYHDDGWIVCNDDGTWVNPDSLTRCFTAFLIKHRLKRIRFHDLRHTFASLMLKANNSLKVVSAMLGHSTIAITADIYTHIGNEQKQDAATKFSDMIFGENKKTTTSDDKVEP
ncbi:MAG: site-specific integrase, partial [Schwartzia sp.]|nr:site-specific integrase [Schwartzia sp. (in: firmicutes)]